VLDPHPSARERTARAAIARLSMRTRWRHGSSRPSGLSPAGNETAWRMPLVKLAALVEAD
jgi:hypothetical protein